MAQRIGAEQFRSVFKVVNRENLQWFPGHMNKGLKQMQTKLKMVDCVIEVHDARIPLSGRNSDFKYTISGVKPHILVLNKVDLIEQSHIEKIRNSLKYENPHVIFTDCKSQKCKGIASLLPLMKDLIESSDRYNRSEETDWCALIIGIPNVGKSSLINALRTKYIQKGNATPIGAKPGVTKTVLTKIRISNNPLCYLFDTPGILTPNISDTETGLKLALCATLRDHLVGPTVMADYLLFWLNKNGYFDYVKMLELEKATDDVLQVLVQICAKHKKMLKRRDSTNEYVYKPNFDWAAEYFLKAFREGELGKLLLDEDLL